MTENIVDVIGLSHRYSAQWAVEDISFKIDKKGVWGLLGSNGAGKSTTMNIICGVLNQTKGEVSINGVNIKDNPVKAKRDIGFLPQKPPLHIDLTVDEYLIHCAYLRQMNRKDVKRAVSEAKDKCGITHYSKRVIKNLSGGYQQRLGIAQAIIHSPKFVVLDEPTNGLDPNQIIEVRELIRTISIDHAVLLSTHILSEVQATCNYIKMIDSGKLVFSGSMTEFNNYIEPNSLIVNLQNPPDINVLLNIQGIIEVEAIKSNEFRMRFDTQNEIAEKVIEMSVHNGWRLREISLERSSLDEIFAELSQAKLKHNIKEA